MQNLCDVNVLLAIVDANQVFHEKANSWLNQMGKPDDVVICRLSQLAMLRLLSNPSVMGRDVRTLKEAWDIHDTMMSDERFVFRSEPSNIDSIFRKLTVHPKTSYKLLQDAYLAAFAESGGMKLVTFDKDFRNFSGLNMQILS